MKRASPTKYCTNITSFHRHMYRSAVAPLIWSKSRLTWGMVISPKSWVPSTKHDKAHYFLPLPLSRYRLRPWTLPSIGPSLMSQSLCLLRCKLWRCPWPRFSTSLRIQWTLRSRPSICWWLPNPFWLLSMPDLRGPGSEALDR